MHILYLTKQYSCNILLPLLIPNNKSQVIWVAAALINFKGNVLIWVAASNTVWTHTEFQVLVPR